MRDVGGGNIGRAEGVERDEGKNRRKNKGRNRGRDREGIKHRIEGETG